ncbi:MAG: nitrate ABC transporter substrate-binding protein [Nitrospinota bacterium]|nr:nitrate ABC transporter substrate-binding protein [Nitrospinota bacterium]
MPRPRLICLSLGAAFLVASAGAGLAEVKYVQSPPLSRIVSGKVSGCPSTSEIKVPLIAWGGDITTVHANGDNRKTQDGSVFSKSNLKLDLFREDNFAKQVEAYMECKTPFLRGTMGMINMAADVTEKDARTKMVILYKLTDSAGGDALVVKPGIKNPRDLKGKTIALQRYGPHVDYLTTVLDSVGLQTGDVNLKWVEDLIELDDSSNSPAKALREDPSVDAAFVIIPDALALTSEGKVGTGSEDSVKGASILLSTKTADRVIMDVYAVRSDYYRANKAQVAGFVQGLFQANEKVSALFKKKQSQEFKRMIEASAEILLDSKGAAADTEAMYGDARHSGFQGNASFFSAPDKPRSFEDVSSKIQNAFIPLGLMSAKATLAKADWDYPKMSAGLSGAAAVAAPRFDTKAVTALVTDKQRKGSLSEGELFSFEVYFGPNQNTFPVDIYKESFDKVIELVSVYGGALLTIEGHSDPSNYLRQKVKNEPPMVLNQIKQSARNLSYARANALKDNLVDYARSRGVTLDKSQFGVVGHGIMAPNTANCSFDASGDITKSCYPASKKEWDLLRRVVFRLIQVEAEVDIFKPL